MNWPALADVANRVQPHVSSIPPSNVTFDVGEPFGCTNLGGYEENVVPFSFSSGYDHCFRRYRSKGKKKVQDEY